MSIQYIKSEKLRFAIIIFLLSLLYWSYYIKFRQEQAECADEESWQTYADLWRASEQRFKTGKDGEFIEEDTYFWRTRELRKMADAEELWPVIAKEKIEEYRELRKVFRQRPPSWGRSLIARELPVAEIIVQDFDYAAAFYEWKFMMPIPNCGQCSDLELLLILEKANNTHIPYTGMPYIMKRRTPYFDYLNSFGEAAYQSARAVVGYELWFERPPPAWNCSDEERIERLKRAIETESPYLTENEEAMLKTKYLKKFKRPITNFEFSLTKVTFSDVGYLKPPIRFTVTRTPTGALAKRALRRNFIAPSRPDDAVLTELKLNMDEWLVFVNGLYMQYIAGLRSYYVSGFDGGGFTIRLFFENKDEMEFYTVRVYPRSWNNVLQLMSDIGVRLYREGIPVVVAEH